MSKLCTLDSDCSGSGATCIVHTPPSGVDFNSVCNGSCSSCTIENGCTACYCSAERQLYGWAKVLSLGDDGWIKLNGGTWQVDVRMVPFLKPMVISRVGLGNGGTFDPGADPNDSADDTGTRKGFGLD